MTRLLLDTSGYSAFMRGHSEVVAALQEADEVCFNPVILGELLAGFMRGKSLFGQVAISGLGAGDSAGAGVPLS